MRSPMFLFGAAIVFSTTALGEDDCRCWTPNMQQIAKVEAKLEGRAMPLGKLERYARYYAGGISGNSQLRFIRGDLVPLDGNNGPGIHIVEGKMPPLKEEGCISVSDSEGGGPWMRFRCARPGAWTPSDAQIAELEALFRQYGSRDERWERWELGYARHYAGVTEGDRRIILGEFNRDETPGIYVASEVELHRIDDGGCTVVHVRYDVSSKKLTSECGGR